jgi:hypothetical protein
MNEYFMGFLIQIIHLFSIGVLFCKKLSSENLVHFQGFVTNNFSVQYSSAHLYQKNC